MSTRGHHGLMMGDSDPYWQSVKVLLPMSGSNGGTSFPEVTGKSFSRLFATTSTDTAKFGASSGKFTASVSGVGNAVYADSAGYASDLTIGSGDFTVEMWAYLSSLSGTPHFVLIHNGTFSDRCNLWYRNSDNKLMWYREISGTGVDVASATGVLAIGVWTHLAVSRAGSTLRMFVDGSVVATVTDSATYPTMRGFTVGSVQPLASGAGDGLNGYAQEVRFTKGVARYTGAFTPPSAPFPRA